MSLDAARNNQRNRRIEYPYLLLLVFLILLLVSYPYLGTWFGELLLAGVFTAIVLSCIYSVSSKKQTLWLGVGLSIPAFVQRFGELLSSETVGGGAIDLPFRELYSLPLYIYIVYMIFRDILNQKDVTTETLRGAICLYLLLGIIWTSFYVTLYQLDPNSFRGVELADSNNREIWNNFLFFSFVTLTTLGYGDIVPVDDAARSLTILEATFGVLYIAVLISRLVSMHGRERKT